MTRSWDPLSPHVLSVVPISVVIAWAMAGTWPPTNQAKVARAPMSDHTAAINTLNSRLLALKGDLSCAEFDVKAAEKNLASAKEARNSVEAEMRSLERSRDLLEQGDEL